MAKSIEDRSTPQKSRSTPSGLWDLLGASTRELRPSPQSSPDQGWVSVVKSKELQLLKRSHSGDCHVPKGSA